MKKILLLLLLALFIFACDSPVSTPVEEPEIISEPAPPEPTPEPPAASELETVEDLVVVEDEPVEEIIPEVEPEPDYTIKYSLSGYKRAESIPWSDDYEAYPFVINSLDKIIQIGCEVDYKDFFLFYNGNTENFFEIDLSYMNLEELDWMAEVLQRYPEESIWVLQEEWYE